MIFLFSLLMSAVAAASQTPNQVTPSLDHLLECSGAGRVEVRTPGGDRVSGILTILVIADENLRLRDLRAATGDSPRYGQSSPMRLVLSVFPMPGEAASAEDAVLPLYSVRRSATVTRTEYVNGEDILLRTQGGTQVMLRYFGSSIGTAWVRSGIVNRGKPVDLRCE